MGNNDQIWSEVLQVIREKLNDPWVYLTWFSPIVFEGYDERRNIVTLRVPSQYVYEYLDHYFSRGIIKLLEEKIGSVPSLQFRIVSDKADGQPVRHAEPAMPVEPTYEQIAGYLTHCRQQHFGRLGSRTHVHIPDARLQLEEGLRYNLGEGGYTWLPAYDKIADWLTDNKGRGLLCIGTCGLGKTLICQRILPAIFGFQVASVTAREMNARIDSLLQERCVIIDDLGTEDVETRNFGNRRRPFFELCDAAERRGALLIITTNLSTTPVADKRYPTSIQERYGVEVLDRLRSTMHAVLLEGKSMRR